MAGYQDLTIADLADDLAVMTSRAIEAEADRDAYKVLVSESLTALHMVTKQRDRLRAELRNVQRMVAA
jgi:hypothetical protein